MGIYTRSWPAIVVLLIKIILVAMTFRNKKKQMNSLIHFIVRVVVATDRLQYIYPAAAAQMRFTCRTTHHKLIADISFS